MAAEQGEARDALFSNITRVLGEISEVHVSQQATIIKDLAAAFRMTYGGAQPGSAIVETKS